MKLEVQGLDEAIKSLAELDRKMQRTIVRRALRAGAKIIKAAAKAEAPRLSGKLAKNIKIRSAGSKKGRARLTVGVGDKDFVGKAFYGAFIEFGHKVGSRRLGDSRKVVPANEFLLRAFEKSADSAADAIGESIVDQVEDG